MKNRYWYRAGAVLPSLVLLASGACSDDSSDKPPDAAPPDTRPQPQPDAAAPDAGLLGPTTYTNPIKLQLPDGASVDNCPDPAIIRSQTPGDAHWYLFCTSNPLNDQDVDQDGVYNYHLLNVHRSLDLVNWEYLGDAFNEEPSWSQAPQGFWAPDVQYFDGKYYLYYTVSDTNFVPHPPAYGLVEAHPAIGVATSDSLAGPWTHAPDPVVEPQAAPCCPFSETETRRRWVIDSNVVTDYDGQRYIYFGSYYGGIAVRKLSADGLSSDPESHQEVVSDERYEGAYVVQRDGFYYLFGSATNCCNGPLTGYAVFVGRADNPLGPFVDRDGVPLGPGPGDPSYPGPGRVGGTPVLNANGNRWVGTGHNSVLTDFAGQDWVVYHAIDRNDAYRGSGPLEAFPEKRHAMLDPLDWIDGWPTVRGGFWASDSEQPGPAAQPGQASGYQRQTKPFDAPGTLITELSDEFDGTELGAQWAWVREPAAGEYALEDGQLRWNTQQADVYKGSNTAAVLTVDVPEGKDFVVETKVTLDVPGSGCCFNFTQAGLLMYKNDDAFLKLAHFALWDTRQIEWAKEVEPASVPADYPIYGNTVAGPPGETTYLRIIGRVVGVEEAQYTAYTSLDGATWYQNGVWTHDLGADAKIGLVSMGRTPETTQVFVARFDYVRVYELAD
jgi:arabinan endo-1,5-alpha-L-arabinosidase